MVPHHDTVRRDRAHLAADAVLLDAIPAPRP
jgi:hypothetical protein